MRLPYIAVRDRPRGRSLSTCNHGAEPTLGAIDMCEVDALRRDSSVPIGDGGWTQIQMCGPHVFITDEKIGEPVAVDIARPSNRSRPSACHWHIWTRQIDVSR